MSEIVKNHRAGRAWKSILGRVSDEMVLRQVHPARTVVLLPYAQLMPLARQVWLDLAAERAQTSGFLPRFETTVNWGRSLGGCAGLGDELRMDAARDLPTAQALVRRAGLGQHQAVLGPKLMEAAWALARLAAAVPPAQRPAWGDNLGAALATEVMAPELGLEAAVARIALAWAANSAYPTDPVFNDPVDLLVVIQGFQDDPLTNALVERWGERALVLPWAVPGAGSTPRLHAARDAEDEALRAAACVLSHLQAGRAPVALVAQDRVLTRRVRAILDGCQLAVRDETGWKLSTTRAAAGVMGLLRASRHAATADTMLDWLKNAPAFDAGEVAELESLFRRRGGSQWQASLAAPALQSLLHEIRDTLQAGRPLVQWLPALQQALKLSGQWAQLLDDRAGQALVQALRLAEGAWQEFSDMDARMSLASFTAWVDQTLEAGSYLPQHPPQAQVIILPLSQLLGRPLAAVVLPGCDEQHLAVSPDPGGDWTPAQVQRLGLPSRQDLARAMRSAWDYALGFEELDLLWRQSEGGEATLASGFVLELLLQGAGSLADDPRHWRELVTQPCTVPAPQAAALLPQRLSSSAYEDLRRCPFRFFALRQLGLQDAQELESEVDKRDVGIWLHAALRHFHEALVLTPHAELPERRRLMDQAAARATQEQGLPEDEFLPYAAAWPRLREGYLEWLAKHEAEGARFVQAEIEKTLPLGQTTLVGKLDRLDRRSDGSLLVMDYKTESRTRTQERVKQAGEDTQLAFYAALMADVAEHKPLSAAYVSIREKEGTLSCSPDDLDGLRVQLLQGIAHDMRSIAGGSGLPALGQGSACDHCAARGLCRRDWWDTTQSAWEDAHA